MSNPRPHPRLAQLQSLSTVEKQGRVYFGASHRYQKRGIEVVVLKGDPYELGYARGVLLKDEIRNWVGDNLYMIKKQSLGTDIGIDLMVSRAREVEHFIPAEYTEELNGLSAGSEIDYEMLLMLNVLDTIGRTFGCTSVAVKGKGGKLLRSRNLDYKDYAIFKPDTLEFWIAIDPPPAARGRWVGFSLTRELHGQGTEPQPQIIPAMDFFLKKILRIG